MPGWQAAGQRAGACPRRPAPRTRIWPGHGCHRPRRRAPAARRTPCRTGGPRPQPPACRHAHRDPPAARPRYAQAARPPSPPTPAPGLCHHGHEPEREAPVPLDDGVQQLTAGRQRPMPGRWPPEASLLATARHPVLRARTPAVRHGSVAGAAALALTASGPARRPGNLARARPDPRSSRPAFPRLPGCRPWQDVPAGQNQARPSMYEMEGPCPAPPRRLASCLVFAARRAPPAGARYPREGPVSRLLPRSRRRPRVVPVSNGESIITTAGSTAQGPAASHFLLFRYPRKTPQKAGSYPHFTQVIHGFTHSLPKGCRVSDGEHHNRRCRMPGVM